MKYKVTLNGKTYEVEVENGEAMLLDEYDALAPAPAPVAAPAAVPAAAPVAAPAVSLGSGEKINSPMPGVILRINVSEGQTVKKGDILAVLEAMKMENEIMAPHDAVVGLIAVAVGAKVETGTPILVLK